MGPHALRLPHSPLNEPKMPPLPHSGDRRNGQETGRTQPSHLASKALSPRISSLTLLQEGKRVREEDFHILLCLTAVPTRSYSLPNSNFIV